MEHKRREVTDLKKVEGQKVKDLSGNGIHRIKPHNQRELRSTQQREGIEDREDLYGMEMLIEGGLDDTYANQRFTRRVTYRR